MKRPNTILQAYGFTHLIEYLIKMSTRTGELMALETEEINFFPEVQTLLTAEIVSGVCIQINIEEFIFIKDELPGKRNTDRPMLLPSISEDV